ncbi:SDR family oxidoreductase [Deinococcus sp. Leaf326]|uniref:SDR family oxidoreductase n=1 Tax=Deinococcus sp. Leaf326 TaxID=1736338 RepID=UPI0006FE4FC4|nr:SDR family oxidoreductase [Deinococcus sp. Leaf326]KQR01046.1 3-oxoacyl-ACP reductase [Deinococcus sp. Leaf326]
MNLFPTPTSALVTAASSGLGFATAMELAREGASVALCSRDLARAQAAAQEITAATGAAVVALEADVRDAEACRRVVEEAAGALGGLNVLVCNAGGPAPGGFERFDDAAWTEAFELTLMSTVRLTRAALPHLRAGGGRILTIVSSSVKRPLPNLTLSNVLRPAVHGLMKSLSTELAPDIAVNCIAPGRVLTERIQELDEARASREGRTWEEVRAQTEREIPLGRLGDPAEFGRVAAFLCSPAASYITGSTVLVDGGAVTNL